MGTIEQSYGNFVETILKLAQSFDKEPILKLVKQYI
jgi:hypothetical protein